MSQFRARCAGHMCPRCTRDSASTLAMHFPRTNSGSVRTFTADPVSVLKAISERNKSGAEHFKVANISILCVTSRCHQAVLFLRILNTCECPFRLSTCSRYFLWLRSALSLFVLGVLTDNANTALSFDNLALFADRFHR